MASVYVCMCACVDCQLMQAPAAVLAPHLRVNPRDPNRHPRHLMHPATDVQVTLALSSTKQSNDANGLSCVLLQTVVSRVTCSLLEEPREEERSENLPIEALRGT